MRKLVLFTTTTALLGLSAAASAGVRYVAADDSAESQLCVSAAVDKHFRFENKVELSGIPYKTVAAKLDCNGVNVAQFSADAGNSKVAERLSRYSPMRGEVQIRQAQAQPKDGADVVVLVKGE